MSKDEKETLLFIEMMIWGRQTAPVNLRLLRLFFQ